MKEEQVIKENENTELDAKDKAKQNKETKENTDKKTVKKNKKEKTNKGNKKDKEIEELKLKNTEINDKYLRLSAEFDNYRKRTLKEKTDLLQTASGDVLHSMLSVVDDFERALKVMGESEDIKSVKEGVNLIYNNFIEFMKSKNMQEIEALNCDFDTDYHEAITKIPAPTEELKGKVVDVIKKGYKINDKVIRFSQVVIGE